MQNTHKGPSSNLHTDILAHLLQGQKNISQLTVAVTMYKRMRGLCILVSSGYW